MRLEATSFLRVLLFSLPLLTNCESKTSKIKKCDWDSSTCACETDQGSIRLDKMTDAPFKIKDEKTNSFFFWHPCRDFTEGTVTAGAIQQQVPSTYLDLGVHSSLVTEITADGHVIFKMLSDSKERKGLF
ncbi:hypothetical protein RRG08_059589 [Elysia crispata]|uniref:Uncharacterized protein n=1 Tax=Elysia crispata TaxID=231223 RepID=A0AAE1D643_9GAST|nr:hypothetical protein RRG08_059589 [Elysia crispata]